MLFPLPVLAHSGHYQNQPESKKQETETSNQPSQSVPASKQEASSSQTHNNNEVGSSSQTNDQPKTEPVEEQSTAQAQFVTIEQVPMAGETVLGLIVATPFLLYALRKRIHQ